MEKSDMLQNLADIKLRIKNAKTLDGYIVAYYELLANTMITTDEYNQRAAELKILNDLKRFV